MLDRLAHPGRAARALARPLRLRELGERLDERLPHGRRTTRYAGVDLVYSRRYSLVERIERWGAYEPEIVASVREAVLASDAHTFVDVGANIGLISLAVLEADPQATVYAFEPGPHQRSLFAETIRRNRLSKRIELSELALSDSTGTAEFAVHSTRHAAGDGFLDTRRAGRARSITVRTDALDAWWERRGRPRIDVVKLDTEGSELLVLRGAEAVLEACRPTLFLEIHETNLEPYPYDAADVRRFVEERGYALEPFGSTEFAARPR